MAEAMPVTPELLTWARKRSGYGLAVAAKKFRRIAEWECGAGGPTYPQLERLAKKFRIPVTVFFFPEPPRSAADRSVIQDAGVWLNLHGFRHLFACCPPQGAGVSAGAGGTEFGSQPGPAAGYKRPLVPAK